MERLKEKIVNGELTLGSWVTLSDLATVEIMAKAGFDWLVIDMEHTGLSMNQVQDMIRVIDLCGISPFVRVMKNDPDIIKKCMDLGAHGVVVPLVKNEEEAQRVVNAVKYPPIGTRGVGLNRAHKYSLDLDSYMEWNQENSIVIVQVEHHQAVENLEEIMSVEGVDAFIIGPYDLSGSIDLPGKFEHPKVKELLNVVDVKSKTNQYRKGFHIVDTDKEKLKQMIERGYTFIAYGVDFLYFSQSVDSGINDIKLL